MNISKKITAATVWCSLYSLPGLLSQNTIPPPMLPKWEFGLRAGAGVNTIHLEGRQPRAEYFLSSVGTRLYGNNDPKPEFQSGVYATRFLRQGWSVRSELTLVSNDLNRTLISLGVFPRYRVTNWLNLEAGLETGFPLFDDRNGQSRVSFGTAFGTELLELNFRFSPSYQAAIPYGRSEWLGTFQAGASVRLASVGKLFK